MKREAWTFGFGGGDRMHFYCARCDTSVTVLLPMGLDEAAALMRAYQDCHLECTHRLWNERTRLLRLLRRRVGGA